MSATLLVGSQPIVEAKINHIKYLPNKKKFPNFLPDLINSHLPYCKLKKNTTFKICLNI